MKSDRLKAFSNMPYSAYRHCIAFCLIFFAFNLSFSQRFTATANTREVPLNYTFDITYSVENGELQRFVPPKFDGFDAMGPSTSNNISVVNGRVSRSVSYTYTLQPKKQGEFNIGPASAIISGNEMKTNSVYIKVVAPVKQSPQEEQQQEQVDAVIKDNLFLKAIPDKTTIYQGEQFTVSYKLYYRLNLENILADKMPEYDGFLAEEYALDEKRRPAIERYNNKDFYTFEFKRSTLFPTKSGKFNLTPLEFSGSALLTVYEEVMPGFTMPQMQDFEFHSKSNSININVLPLPEKNKPVTFSGAVGKFSFDAKYNKTKVKVGEPISLKITYSGSGNFKLITPPKLEFPEEFEAYEPKVSDNYTNNGSVVAGSKTFEYIILPQDGGKFKLPKYEFAYFDVDKKDYVKFTLPETEIDVEGKAKISENLVNFFKREKEDKPKGIYGIRKQYASVQSFAGSASFWTLTMLPFAILLFGFIYRKRDYSESDLLLLRRKKANKLALKRMATAKKLMQHQNEQGFYNEVIRALWEYLSDKLYISQSALSKENIAEQLSLKNIPPEKIDALKETLDTCEQSLFSPEGKVNAMQQTYSKAVELIIDFEEQLKS